jgi:protease I
MLRARGVVRAFRLQSVGYLCTKRREGFDVTHHQQHDLSGKRVAVVATDMVEQVEMTEPWKALEEAGARPELISIERGEIQGFKHYDKADTFKVDRAIDEADSDDYEALLLPGGVGNPDTLRLNEKVVDFVRTFIEQGKPVAAICHAPWTLVEADVVGGRKLTSWPSLKTDIRNAAGEWVDEQVVVDRGLVTSRKPDDLPVFIAKMLEEFAEGRHAQRRAVHAETAAS